ncbi:uncharacterized protein L3040_007325 [Drepanopeziza brunnea f. sp. 'multigermtubi']|uniref:Putative apoptosis-inducing factor 1 n=1 Tax=Marssonina brunnea f. sp. multigermtubi (strain MB_m1) TaxID=1072389 RepID=K1X5D3_MARBU|nr:putative apoptosis-inducing factor 1 [Drepanopeziza brunnea f. sp. 'multigermtubi' MB_m1]EKD20317.1 putative apoptosis-inducing factor 1 [Drepanopeziza brunnea f. sp. 'multigermtubi' MB_m1]KAJ5038467.1 hypothetical protein L3040_007325 [Drepanopeziza brunnea f. sp. 'multigermtubi']
MSTHEILILGGHHAGLNSAHYLLRHVVPKLSKLNSTTYRVTIVTPNNEFFWNIAAPRLIVSETLIPEEKVFLPISPAFASYGTQFSLVHGKATDVDAASKTVSISNGEQIKYDTLVIATGSHYASPVWALNNSDEALKSEIRALVNALASAKSVLIAGGGAVGVETAGEIGAQFTGIDITIFSGSSRLLPKLLPANSASAAKQLANYGVKTVNNDVKVSSTEKNPDGTTTVTLSDGATKTVDVFIDATGAKPNSSFLPPAWLTASKHVNADKTCRTPFPGVYAIGDVASFSNGSVIDVQNSVQPLGTSIGIDLAGKEGVFKQKEFKGLGATQFVPCGPSGGVGQVFGWRVPSLAVWAGKCRTYLVWMAQGGVDGDAAKKA